MGQSYSVEAKLKFKNNDPSQWCKAIKDYVQANDGNSAEFNLGRFGDIDWNDPFDCFKVVTTTRAYTYEDLWCADFDASYGWAVVLLESFSRAAFGLEDGSEINIGPWESDEYIITVEGGDVYVDGEKEEPYGNMSESREAGKKNPLKEGNRITDTAKQIADFITDQASENTDNGSWAVYFDEIEDEFGVDLSEDKELAEKVIDDFDYEKVAEAELMEDGYDLVMYLDYCKNLEEDVWAERGFGENKMTGRKKPLKEGKWNYTLENGSALRSAIDDGDLLGVCAMLQCCYQELAEKGIIDDYDCQEACDDIDAIDLDDEDAEDELDYYLSDFYDLCDNLRVWIPLR